MKRVQQKSRTCISHPLHITSHKTYDAQASYVLTVIANLELIHIDGLNFYDCIDDFEKYPELKMNDTKQYKRKAR